MSFWLLPTSVSCCILEWPISPIWLGAKEKLKLFDTKSLSPLKMQPNTYFRDRLFVTIPTKFVKRILLSAQNGNVCRATRDSSKNSLTIFSTTTVGSRLDASLYPFTAVLWTEGRGVFPTKSDSRNRSQSPWDWRHLTECSCSSLKKKKKKTTYRAKHDNPKVICSVPRAAGNYGLIPYRSPRIWTHAWYIQTLQYTQKKPPWFNQQGPYPKVSETRGMGQETMKVYTLEKLDNPKTKGGEGRASYCRG